MLPVMNPDASRSNCRASGMLDQDEDLFFRKEWKGPRASTGSLVGGVRVQKAPVLLPAHW